MDKKKYNNCMKPYITGTGLKPEERKLRFCIGAKVCSGKANTEEDARLICLQPKPAKEKAEEPKVAAMAEELGIPKPKKMTKSDKIVCRQEMVALTECVREGLKEELSKRFGMQVADDVVNIMSGELIKCKCGA